MRNAPAADKKNLDTLRQRPEASLSPAPKPLRLRLLRVLGPGLITGASDDDPSGIATYTQTGAQFGYDVAWTLLFSYPLMAAIQIISARIGRTTDAGIAGNLRRFYPNWIVYSGILLLLVANTINPAPTSARWGRRSGFWSGGPRSPMSSPSARSAPSCRSFSPTSATWPS